MKFYSTTNRSHKVSLQEAVLEGLAPGGGLYMPETIPALPDSFFSRTQSLSLSEIAVELSKPFLEADFSNQEIQKIIDNSITFDCPLVEVSENIYALELFHGPTLAFKDFGARFMAQLLRHYASQLEREVTVLVATSGDTGSAVAHGFYKIPGIRVVIPYPSGKVSNLQEKQFASMGHNIHAVKVDGTFDDCQKLVKTSFQDEDLKQSVFLTSANSINISRLIPQMFYYVYAWSRLKDKGPVGFSVPSGNFGNLTAGLMAKRMGLPVQSFIASTNINDIVPAYLSTKLFEPRASKTTISNAMDVGNPSNFSRILDLYEHDWSKIIKDISGYSFTDDETRTAVKEVFEKFGYTLDPHGAVAYSGIKKFKEKKSDAVGVFLETAHPAKFNETIEKILKKPVALPDSLLSVLNKEVISISCTSEYDSFKSILKNL